MAYRQSATKRPLILWGGTGQALVVRPIVEEIGYELVCVFDSNSNVKLPFGDVKFGGGWNGFIAWRKSNVGAVAFAVCIGGTMGRDRVALSEKLIEHGLESVCVIHSRAWVAQSAKIGRGAQVLAMASVCEGVRLGDFSIVNTNSTIDHSSATGRGVHIMPGATIAGDVSIGDFVTVGSNATILPRVRIGAGATVGAGAVVTRDIAQNEVVIGCPARPMRRRR